MEDGRGDHLLVFNSLLTKRKTIFNDETDLVDVPPTFSHEVLAAWPILMKLEGQKFRKNPTIITVSVSVSAISC